MKKRSSLANNVAEILEASRQMFHEELRIFLKDHPAIKSISWAQYVPFWNDGDPCAFKMDDPEVLLENQEEFSHISDVPSEHRKAMKDLEHLLNCDEAFYLFIFGDNVKVFVDSDKIEVEDYVADH